MSYITQSLARQSAILSANSAELGAIRASQAQQDLIGRGGNFNSVARAESRIEAEKLRNETKARVARAQRDSLSKKKLNYLA